MTTVLLLGAGGSAAANVVDALRHADRGYRIVGADASPAKLHLSLADDRVLIPLAAADGYERALVGAITEYACEVVHPQPDPDVRALSALRDRLPARTFLPSVEAIEIAADKARLAQRLAAADVPVPEAVSFEDRAHVKEATSDLLSRHERVWVRARSGAGSRAALPVRSEAHADAWVDWWVQERGLAWTDFMASEMLPGREFAYQSLWQDGELVVGQARERVEYFYAHVSPSGQTSSPSIARTVDEPSVDEVAMASIRALDPTPQGVYCVDIKEGADGGPKVTEINLGRFFTTSNFFAAAGVNMPDMLIRCALGEQLPHLGTSPLDPDLYWLRMVDMGYRLVPGEELDRWPRPGAWDRS